jgi:inosine-uridine nucleoside N-ribohydrolase
VPPFVASLPEPIRYLALGPLTNLAASVAPGAPLPAEAIIVGGNLSSPGRWPPWFPFEFNLTKDARALRTVWASPLPLTLLPLDVARSMRVTRADLKAIHGPIGCYLRQNSSRWFTRSRLLKWSSTIPLYDLPAAIYAIDSGAAPITEQYADLHSNGWIDFRRGSRQVRVIRSFDRDRIWGRFLTVLGRQPSEGPARGSAARPGG